MGSHENRSSSAPSAEVAAALDALRRVVQILRVASTSVEKSYGVSGAQLFVLGELASGQTFSIAELASRTATDPSSVSVVVARLVERGFAVRRTSSEDARRAEIEITAAGKALLGEAPTPFQAKLFAALGDLPEAELAALTGALRHVVTALGADEGAAPMFFEEEPSGRRAKGRGR